MTAALLAVPAGANAGKSGAGAGSTACSRKAPCATPPPDTTAPTVSIAAPSHGATVSGVVSVNGKSSDNSGVDRIEVRIDGGSVAPATGTSAWSHVIDTRTVADGDHTIEARAVDGAGNGATATIVVRVQNAPAGGGEPGSGSMSGDTVVRDAETQYDLFPLGRTRLAAWGSLTGVVFTEQWTDRKVAFFRDAATGATSTATLPSDGSAGWYNAAFAMPSRDELWVLGGGGPLYLRHYRLSGSPLPTSATLVSSRTLGDADSRPADLLATAAGGLVASWHQQGNQGPQGLHVGYRPAGGAWAFITPLTFTPTMASNQVLAQHPTDGGIWLFSNADTSGRIDAVRFIERGTTLEVSDQRANFITASQDALNAPDPENPVLAAAANPVKGTIDLAYQSADRRFFGSGSQLMVGSRVAVARIAADGALSFTLRAPVWAERVSPVGLMVVNGEPAISYLAVDSATLTAQELTVSRFSDGSWTAPTVLGRKDAGTQLVGFGVGRLEVMTKLDDGRIHLRSL